MLYLFIVYCPVRIGMLAKCVDALCTKHIHMCLLARGHFLTFLTNIIMASTPINPIDNKVIKNVDDLVNYLEYKIRQAGRRLTDVKDANLLNDQRADVGELSILSPLLTVVLHPQDEKNAQEPAVNRSSIHDNGLYVALGKLLVNLQVVPADQKHSWLTYLATLPKK